MISWPWRGVPLLAEGEDLLSLNTGDPAAEGNRAIIAPGTGLGEAFTVRDGPMFRTFAIRGGHCDFGPRNSLEWELWHYLQQKNGACQLRKPSVPDRGFGISTCF